MTNPTVLDACCGSRMWWYDKTDPRAVYVDRRHETFVADTRKGRREVVVNPDVLADFTALPFADGHFSVVLFDPPHSIRTGKKGWLANKYGRLETGWQDMLRKGFAECFRVLKPGGTLVFKWSESDIPAAKVLALTPEKPLVGTRGGKAAKTLWIVFLKAASADVQPPPPLHSPQG